MWARKGGKSRQRAEFGILPRRNGVIARVTAQKAIIGRKTGGRPDKIVCRQRVIVELCWENQRKGLEDHQSEWVAKQDAGRVGRVRPQINHFTELKGEGYRKADDRVEESGKSNQNTRRADQASQRWAKGKSRWIESKEYGADRTQRGHLEDFQILAISSRQLSSAPQRRSQARWTEP